MSCLSLTQQFTTQNIYSYCISAIMFLLGELNNFGEARLAKILCVVYPLLNCIVRDEAVIALYKA